MTACPCQGKLSKLQVGIKIMAMMVITSRIRSKWIRYVLEITVTSLKQTI
jgi:hypothetical protein